jgi:hypothetical protein
VLGVNDGRVASIGKLQDRKRADRLHMRRRCERQQS